MKQVIIICKREVIVAVCFGQWIGFQFTLSLIYNNIINKTNVNMA